ncbi:unnamed protein product [Caretta caretta]
MPAPQEAQAESTGERQQSTHRREDTTEATTLLPTEEEQYSFGLNTALKINESCESPESMLENLQ